MNNKRIWFVIPAALLPYLLLCALVLVFLSPRYPTFGFIMEHLFHNSILYLAAFLLIWSMLATVLSVICFFMSIRKEWDVLSLAKTAMTVKLIQVPAYILIFILGVVLAISLFTIPFSIALFMFDCLTLFLTGLLTTAAVIIAVRQRIFTFKEATWLIILQLFFCADVVASIVLFLKLRRKTGQTISTQLQGECL